MGQRGKGVSLDHQVQQFQEAAPVVPGPAGFLGSNMAQGAAGADQPLHLQSRFLSSGSLTETLA